MIHSRPREAYWGGFIQGRAKEMEGSILSGSGGGGGFFLEGPEMNHSRAGEAPPKSPFQGKGWP